MKKFGIKAASIFILLVCIFGYVPVFQAQNLGGTVRVLADPQGPYFLVDGKVYNAPMSAVWPAGSKHVVSLDAAVQNSGNKIQYTFGGWSTNAGAIPGVGTLSLNVTADPSITEYRAKFGVQYALTLNFFNCPDPSQCYSPGQILVGGSAYSSNAEVYISPGLVELLAVPNPGFVFVGWGAGAHQTTQGPFNHVDLSQPVSVYPQFALARKITVATIPDGLEVLADSTPVPTPSTFDWGYGTTHSVGPVSPQQDMHGTYWVFGSWSDGGASTHAYTVPSNAQPETLVATYVRAVGALFTTTPAGLKLKIDGRDNWPNYGFTWGVGETHHIEAAAQQTDAQGRTWKFSGWSNGGPAAQDVTMTPDMLNNALRLNATFAPVGKLTVVSASSGLTVKVDGQDCATPCEVTRDAGIPVHVSAPASLAINDNTRADFIGWPGGGTGEWVSTLGADPITLHADYRTMNRLAASATPPEGVVWNLQPFSQDGFYDAQSNVNVSVTAQPGFRFKSWNGDLSGTRPAGVVSMVSPRSVQAVLDRIPYIAPAGVSNAASKIADAGVAAGSAMAISGASLAPEMNVGPDNPLTQTLSGVLVRISDRMLPLFFVSPTQINVQLPDDITTGSQSLTVTAAGMPDVKATFNVVRNAPGLFQQTSDTQSLAVAAHEDGSPITASAPAIPGELITVFGTGFGPTDRPRPYGFAVPDQPAFSIVDSVTVVLGDNPIPAENAFAQPGRVAVDAAQFHLPVDTPSGSTENVKVRVGGVESNTVVLLVQ
jgi:uncharacterized protein (TIGR03437 family)